MRFRTFLVRGLLSVLVAAVIGCGGHYSGSVTYQEGGYAPPPPPPPPPAPAVVVVAGEPAMVQPTAAEVDVAMFYDNLAPYGRWVVVASYGRVFVPAGIARGWRPYTLGRWEYTDYGLTWISEEPFGWATCHYGGWVIAAGYGWVWVPGTHWGPAWVAWREGGGYAGWAPLPPNHGVEINISITNGIPADHFCFVEDRYMTAPRVHEHAVTVERNTTIINRTTNITNVKVVNNKVVNESMTVERVEKVTGTKVQKKVVRTTDKTTKSEVRGNEVEIYHPKPAPKTPSETAKPNVVQPIAPKPNTPQNPPPPNTVQPAGRGTATPQRPGTVTPAPAAAKSNPQYEAALKKLKAQHADEAKDLEAKQAKEKPGTLTAAQLKKRQDAEKQKLDDEHQKELADLKKKYKVID